MKKFTDPREVMLNIVEGCDWEAAQIKENQLLVPSESGMPTPEELLEYLSQVVRDVMSGFEM